MTIHQFPSKQSIPIPSENLWLAYVNAAKRAQESLRMDDGILAGKAWAAFMRAFEE
jgi:hypothetical protein